MTAFLDPPAWRRNPLRLLLWAIPTALLIAPAVAMRFTPEVVWTASDFVFAAILLFGATALADWAMRASGSWPYRLGAGVAVLTSFLTIWINAAVGMIGSEDNPLNLLFVGVILLGLAGAIGARFEAAGMARAMTLAASGQAAIAITGFLSRWGAAEPPGFPALFVLLMAFAALWALSAALFAKAARDRLRDS